MKKFYLIDDDENIRSILTDIIEEENIGIVVGEASDGLEGSMRWSFYNPDIIIVDYLMPNLDGSKAIEAISSQGFRGKFVMLSQVDDSSMKGEAYEKGASFYLSKPINYIEVKKVLEMIGKTIDLENSLSLIQNTLTGLTSLATEVQKPTVSNMIGAQRDFDKAMYELGVIGESGRDELREVITYILNLRGGKYTLKEVYKEIPSSINARSVEQRIRRLIQKSLHNIAELGLVDTYDPIYTRYNSCLFDIAEIHREMSYLEGKSFRGGKVSLKKFIEGLVSIINIKD